MNRNNGRNPRPDLQLRLAPGEARERSALFRRAVRNEDQQQQQQDEENNNLSGLSSEEDEPGSPHLDPMVLTSCPLCLMYVMLPRNDLKCPKCKKPLVLHEALSRRS
ncbi:hypothetical protein LUZ60_013353 [Juncus effusus]|nr:hypothetical protein LUZ60_013353 [Juncus effusus]